MSMFSFGFENLGKAHDEWFDSGAGIVPHSSHYLDGFGNEQTESWIDELEVNSFLLSNGSNLIKKSHHTLVVKASQTRPTLVTALQFNLDNKGPNAPARPLLV
jgi:hypothetical protein